MNVSPEIIKAEMDYRVERALASALLDDVRAVRRDRRPAWYRRLGRHGAGASRSVINGRPRTV